jgi:GNAT superfamily N-acetyltransferase
MTDELIIRVMDRSEMAIAGDWAAAEGWNPGLDDAACFATVDPNGFYLGALDGVAASTISVVNYDDSFAFLGFYIVRPDLRGRGYGLRTWRAAIAHAGSRSIGLDGVVTQQENYRKSGFALAHRNIRFGGTPAVPPASPQGLVGLAAARQFVFRGALTRSPCSPARAGSAVQRGRAILPLPR